MAIILFSLSSNCDQGNVGLHKRADNQDEGTQGLKLGVKRKIYNEGERKQRQRERSNNYARSISLRELEK